MQNKARVKTPHTPVLREICSVLLMLVWVAAGMFISELVVAYPMYWLLGDEAAQPFWNSIYAILSFTLRIILVILIPHLLGKKYHKPALTTTREELGLTDLPTWTDILLAPICFIAYYLIAISLTSLFSFFPWFDAAEAQDLGFTYLFAAPDKIIAFLALVVIAPIVEEVIFRGWLYGKLRAKYRLIPCVLLVSLLFGVLHTQWNVGVNVFAMSIVLCIEREITGTVYSGILLHMIKNGLAFYLVYILGV